LAADGQGPVGVEVARSLLSFCARRSEQMRRRRNQVRHKITDETLGILRQLKGLSLEIAPHLRLASPAAQVEWERLRASWPSPEQREHDPIGFSNDELRAAVAKAQRFREILFALAPQQPAEPLRDTTED
jgi:hypothetical protein